MEVVMCNPKNFDVKYEINPWMKGNISRVNKDKAMEQWKNLKDKLEEDGVIVHVMEDHKDCPDMVFAANWGIVIDNTFIAGNFRYKERKKEIIYASRQILDKFGYEFDQCPYNWEGEAELFHLIDDVYIGGWGFRTEKKAFDWFEENYKIKVLRVQLCDENFYHTDTCLTIRGKTVYVIEKAFVKEDLDNLKRELFRLGYSLEKVSNPTDFQMNAVQTPKGWVCHANTDMSEFIKAGGACKCSTLTLKK